MSTKGNEAYDLSLFEPEPKRTRKKDKKSKKKTHTRMKESNLIRLNPRNMKKEHRRKKNPVIIVGVCLLTLLLTGVCITIVQSNVVLNELNEDIIEANNTITQQNNLAAQYRMKVDSRLSASVVQKYAENELKMTQAKNAQKKFISLSDGDYGEVIRNDGSKNVLETVADAFRGMWS